MLLHIPAVLTPELVAQFRDRLQAADWIDGKVTAGYQSAIAKHNLQLAEDNPVARELGDKLMQVLPKNLLFMAAAVPFKIYPPLFNCYREDHAFGTHVDNAIRPVPGTPHRVRTDLSMTLFLSGLEEYDGGELVVEDTFGTRSIRFPAGDAVLYPASSLHRVNRITRGCRYASFFWVQSMVREDDRRTLLLNLDLAIQQLNIEQPDSHTVVKLTGIYHNLVRLWADV